MNQPFQPLDTPIMLFDGAAVGDPGTAAAAAILLLPNGRRYTVSQFLSLATDIEAEYTGLLIGLKKAKQLGIKALEIKGDSELVFNQVNGLTPVDAKKLQSLGQEIQKLMQDFERVSLECISTEQNRSAAAAVNRCIGEALGREAKPLQIADIRLAPDIARLIQLGKKATEGDYQAIGPRLDELAFKNLADLRSLVPEAARDAIALGWDGEEQNLAEIYRWYLRGLPTEMALKKVEIDNPKVPEDKEKLPWEGELLVTINTPDVLIESSEPFVSSPFLEMPPPVVSAPPESIADISKPHDKSELTSESVALSERETLLALPIDYAFDSPQQTIPNVVVTDPSKDTLPSSAKILNVLETLDTLSPEERSLLVHQLVQSADWVNLILQAIAERMAAQRSSLT
jgi:ribonuclease HI